MNNITIEMDNYKEFFGSECGLKLIEELIQNTDYRAVRSLVKWKHCTSEVLEKIAVKFTVDNENGRLNLELLEDVAEHPKVSKCTLEKLFDFACLLLTKYRQSAAELLKEIAESKNLSEELAWKLYHFATNNVLHDVIEELADNRKTPDEVLLDIFNKYDEGTKQHAEASKEIAKRYKNMIEQLKNENK